MATGTLSLTRKPGYTTNGTIKTGAPPPSPATPPATTYKPPATTDTTGLKIDAGPQQEATEWRPAETEMSVARLNSMLASDSPYLASARQRAQEQMQSRGLANSSLALGAGERAAIDAAQPFALQDAGVLARAGEFNANSKNTFALSDNAAANENARTEYQGTLSNNQQARDLELQGSQLTESQRQFNTTAELDRQRIAQQQETARLERERLARQTEADVANRRTEVAGQVNQMYDSALNSMRALDSDPNMSSAAKRVAIDNIIAMTSQNIESYIKFTGIDLPTAWPSWINDFKPKKAAGSSRTPPPPPPPPRPPEDR